MYTSELSPEGCIAQNRCEDNSIPNQAVFAASGFRDAGPGLDQWAILQDMERG